MILRSVTGSPLAVVLLPLALAILDKNFGRHRHYISSGVAYQPEFTEPIVNLTIPVGRDATFRCLVHHLGGYRVGWVKADTKAIQAIHDHVITHNPRVGVSHTDHTTWNLHIKNIQEEDSGQYMCQINTDPMKSQLGVLEVVVPPDFVAEETSGDIMVPEGGIVKLTCKAYGHPEPHVQWRREDGGHIMIRDPSGHRTKALLHQGELLRLVRISRSEMGAYLCIASNGIPPTVSKRIMVSVHFHPVIQVPNQLVGAPLATDVTLECFVEASPRAINYWVKNTGEMVITSKKYEVEIIYKSLFEVRMTLMVRDLQLEDIGTFKCIAKNSIGEVESSIRIYEIPGPTKIYSPPEDMEEGDEEKRGSAERKHQNTATALAPRDTHRSVIESKHVPINSASISGPMIMITILLATFLIFIPFPI